MRIVDQQLAQVTGYAGRVFAGYLGPPHIFLTYLRANLLGQAHITTSDS